MTTSRSNSLFAIVGEEPDQPAPQPQVPHEQQVAQKMLLMALSALSQRFVVAIASLFTLLTVSSVFVLWLYTPSPNTYQLVSLGMYGAFVLATNIIVRRFK